MGRDTTKFVDKKMTGIMELDDIEFGSPSSWGSQEDFKKDIITGFIFKYTSLPITAIVLYVFRNDLPFPFPDFFLLTILILAINFIFHFCLRFNKLANIVHRIMIYFDQSISAPIFLFTGGFLSPFIMTHMIAILGSVTSYSYSKKSLSRPLILTIILLVTYIGVSLLQKFNLAPNDVKFSRDLMTNNVAFYTILSIVSGIIFSGFQLLVKVKSNLHCQYTEMVHSYQHAVKGITSRTGEYFYSDLMLNASKALNAKNIILGILSKDKKYLETIAVVKYSQLSHNFTLPIEDTPFEKVVKNENYYIESDFKETFNDVAFLRGMHVESFYGTSLQNSEGKAIGVLCILRDQPSQYDRMAESLLNIFASRATAEIEKELYEKENKEIEERLFHSQKMEALGKLSGGIAHDFNNMIGGIQGYSEILKIKLKKIKQTDLITYPEKIIVLTKQASTLTSQLLQFARRGGARQQTLDINDEIGSIVDMLNHTITKNVKIVKELNAKNHMVKGDPTQLQNALLNICVNSRDAMPDGGTIIVLTEDCNELKDDKVINETRELTNDTYIKITISDSGIGMPKEILSRIFEPFYTTKKPGSGTGLGLSSVFGCIEKHNGFITVDSEPGKGSSFFIYLPVIVNGN